MKSHRSAPIYGYSAADHRRDVEYFDRWAPGYDRSWTQRIFFRPVHRAVADALVDVASSSSMRILDIGCGTGALLRLLGERYPDADLTGVDASKEMVRVANEANPFPSRLRFLHARAEHLPVGDARFDLVLSTISFHHWADQHRGLSQAAAALTPGGRFFLADHVVTPLQRVFFATGARRRRFHTPAEIDGMLQVAGLRDRRWHRIYAIGPLLLVAGVAAHRATVGSSLV